MLWKTRKEIQVTTAFLCTRENDYLIMVPAFSSRAAFALIRTINNSI